MLGSWTGWSLPRASKVISSWYNLDIIAVNITKVRILTHHTTSLGHSFDVPTILCNILVTKVDQNHSCHPTTTRLNVILLMADGRWYPSFVTSPALRIGLHAFHRMFPRASCHLCGGAHYECIWSTASNSAASNPLNWSRIFGYGSPAAGCGRWVCVKHRLRH